MIANHIERILLYIYYITQTFLKPNQVEWCNGHVAKLVICTPVNDTHVIMSRTLMDHARPDFEIWNWKCACGHNNKMHTLKYVTMMDYLCHNSFSHVLSQNMIISWIVVHQRCSMWCESARSKKTQQKSYFGIYIIFCEEIM